MTRALPTDFNLIFHILLSPVTPLETNATLSISLILAVGRQGGLQRAQGPLPTPLPFSRLLRGQGSGGRSHSPKLTESFATPLGLAQKSVTRSGQLSYSAKLTTDMVEGHREAGEAGFSQHWRRVRSSPYAIILYDAALTALEICHQLLNYAGSASLYSRTPRERRTATVYTISKNEKGKDTSSPWSSVSPSVVQECLWSADS